MSSERKDDPKEYLAETKIHVADLTTYVRHAQLPASSQTKYPAAMNRLLSASDPLVHSVLVALCDDDRVQARALKYLAELEDYATKFASGSGADNDVVDVAGNESSSSNPLKRKASMPAQLCIMCERAFSPGDNSPTACLYHEGQLTLDEGHEVWANWNEDVEGPQFTPENEEDYPQAFIWCKIFPSSPK